MRKAPCRRKTVEPVEVFPDVSKLPFVKCGKAKDDLPVVSWWHVTSQWKWEADLLTGEQYAAAALPELRRTTIDLLSFILSDMIEGKRCSGIEVGFMRAIHRALREARHD